MISTVLALPTKKVFYFYKTRDIANAVIPWVFFQGGYVESGIGKVLRILSQCLKNRILEV
jgi:hypothetical protein